MTLKITNRSKYILTTLFATVTFISWYKYSEPSYSIAFGIITLAPLANIVGDNTESISDIFGDIIGGLLNACFGNLTELLFVFICLYNNLDDLLKISLMGGIVSNLLLVTGMSIIYGSYYYGNQNGVQDIKYKIIHNGSCSLLVICSVAISVPTVVNSVVNINDISLSITVAVCMFIGYILFTISQIRENDEIDDSNNLENCKKEEINVDSEEIKEENNSISSCEISIRDIRDIRDSIITINMDDNCDDTTEHEYIENKITIFDKLYKVRYNLLVLIIATIITGFISDVLAGSISLYSNNNTVAKWIIPYIALAISGNVVEHYRSVTYLKKIELSITIATSSALQLKLLLFSLLVFFGFCRRTHFDLLFPPILLLILVVSSISVWIVLSHGKTTSLEGYQLLMLYAVVVNIIILLK